MQVWEDSTQQKGLCLLALTSKQICKHEKEMPSGGLKIVLIAGIFCIIFLHKLIQFCSPVKKCDGREIAGAASVI